ncbi:MAG: SpaA isopeptide-forming pilin-related protein, partial [Ruminococcus sp.]
YAEDITFTVEKNGTITVDAANKDENDVIIMKDDVTKVSISKKAMTGSDELAGAELKLYYVTQNDQGEVTLEVDAWTSGTEAHVIEGALIAGGTYKLVEITAPDGYQVAESITFTIDKTGKVLVNGEDVNGQVTMYDAALGDVVISKRAVNGTEELEGASLKITDADGKTVAEWVSEQTPKTIQLDAGTYTLTEETAPDGYTVAESIEFVVDAAGKVTVNGEDVNGTVLMEDDTTKVTISKKDITGDNEIPGATLQIKDENGDVVDEWTSTDKPHEINGKLIAGKEYTLHEENAPNGYAYSEDVKFTVDETGKVTEVTMKDDVTKVSISKKTLTGSDELAGAELKLYEVTENEQGETVETEVDAWTSGTEAHVINGKLTAGGTYKLVEITAPDGYQVAEAVTFTVNKDGTLTEVTMHDAVEGEIAISKQSVNSTEELEGAKLKITDATGKTVAEWVSEK